MKLIIYKYTCPENKAYIGITINAKQRIKAHKRSVKSKRKRTKFINAIEKCGFENLSYEELEYPETVEQMRERESYWIIFYDSKNFGYNMNDGGGWSRKFEHSAKKIETVTVMLKEDIHTLREISKVTNVSLSWVSMIKNGKGRNYLPVKCSTRQSQKGSSNSASKLTDAQVLEIQSHLSAGTSRKEIQALYNISKTLVQQVATKQIWNHVPSEYSYIPKETNGNAKLTADIVRQIKHDLTSLTQIEVSAKYNISRSTVQQIAYGRTWKNV